MASSENFETSNPATGEKLKTFQRPTWQQASDSLRQADQDFQWWRKKTFPERAAVLKALAQELRQQKEPLAKCMHLEMGKLEKEALAEIEKCAKTCEFYANEAAKLLKNHKVEGSPYQSAEISYQPLGVILSIMPWNFPLWQALRFAAPALMAGNVVVMKHSDLTAGTAEMLTNLFAKLTPGHNLMRVLNMDHDMTAKLMEERAVRGVTFTGSTTGGRQVAQSAAKNLKKTVLELGGSDAYLILDDADIAKAAEVTALARLQNCGQSCVAGKRFIVTRKNATKYAELMTQEMKKVTLAPLAHKKFQKTVHEQVQKLKTWGGKVLTGGELPSGPGWWIGFLLLQKLLLEQHELRYREQQHGEFTRDRHRNLDWCRYRIQSEVFFGS